LRGRPLSVLLHSRAFYPQIGGLERVSQMLAEQLTALGHKITVLTDTPLGVAPELGPFRVVRGASSDEMHALVEQADLVHVNGFSVQLVRHCWRARKPLIWTHQGHQAVCTEGNLLHETASCHGKPHRCLILSSRTRGIRWALRHFAELVVRRLLLRTARANVCVSGWVASRIRAPRSRVIWNPVDVASLSPADKSGARNSFTYFGRLVPEKGPHVLLESLVLARKRGLPFSLSFVGDGPLMGELVARASQLGVADTVRFHGAMVGAGLREALQKAWAVVVPTVCEEAMGLVAVEAMAAGVPLIVSKRGALPEVATDCALVFENGSSAELVEAMALLSSQEGLWGRMAAAGPSRARAFDSRLIADQYARLYAEMAG
jgi:glycogen synthase